MSLYDSVRDLPLTVEGYAPRGAGAARLERLPAQDDRDPAPGGGEEGVGEDVTYDGGRARPAAGARARCCRCAASGRSTRSRSTSATLPLFDHEPEQHAYLDYRRWAFESAALDLALRQAGALARRRRRARRPRR